jgi:hypothetical protein
VLSIHPRLPVLSATHGASMCQPQWVNGSARPGELRLCGAGRLAQRKKQLKRAFKKEEHGQSQRLTSAYGAHKGRTVLKLG